MTYVEKALLFLSQAGQRTAEAMSTAAAWGGGDALDNPSVTTLILLHSEGPQRPTRIARECRLTSGGATKLMTRLENRGLIVRRTDSVPSDGRAVVVSLTQNGSATIEDMIEAARQPIDELIEGLLEIRGGR